MKVLDIKERTCIQTVSMHVIVYNVGYLYVYRKLATYDSWSGLVVHIAMDNTVVTDDIRMYCSQIEYITYICDIYRCTYKVAYIYI